ncbi:SIMPL domain-containing protein [Eudoraea adriatica]|uniref:SIMPL domain-containing protein n=1 Tax=Eudoraea adriatica TaxID=446681 RepID=UPI0003674B1F|nr:SIMPL domain-containing protein [Eudoraea adriatica]
MKNIVQQKLVLRYLVLFLLITSLKNYGQNKNFIDQPYLETTARVDTLVTPDRIYLSILITEADTKGKASVEKLENKMADKLETLGIDTEKQLTLSDLASNFKKYFLRKADVQKDKEYSLLVYDAVTAGNVILGLESIGISNVNLTKTEYSQLENLKIILRQLAVKEAKKQAEAMVLPLDQQLGSALFISDLNTGILNRYQGRVAEVKVFKDGDKDQPVEIEFEKIEVESTVNVKFSIQ